MSKHQTLKLTPQIQQELNNLKLTIQLRMPIYGQKRNLRKILPKKLWDSIRFQVYKSNGNKCSVCGFSDGQLEAHEVWDYDKEKLVLDLKDIHCLCFKCHSLQHFHHATIRSKDVHYLIDHFLEVNECSKDTYKFHLKDRRIKENIDPIALRNKARELSNGDIKKELEILMKLKGHRDEEELNKKEWKFKVYEDIPYYNDVISTLEIKGLIAI